MQRVWNDEWERENQEILKQWYDEAWANGRGEYSAVRKIICYGCGNVFYTRIDSKKYCNYATCGRIGNYKNQRLKRMEKRKDMKCAMCGELFTPKRNDARYCSDACKQRAYRQRVTDKPMVQNEHLA